MLSRLLGRPRDFTWDEACTLMKQCGYVMKNRKGSARMWVHVRSRLKVRLHEPHPENTLLPYMVKELIEALKDSGEIES